MKDWQNYFLEETLDLGYSYFIEKRVRNFTLKKQQITAKVMDDTEKNATIVLDDTPPILHMTCDCLCPSAEQCPHLVALLFEYETHCPKEYEKELTTLIACADVAQLQSFLTIALQENQRLAQRFHRHISLDEATNSDQLDALISTYKTNDDNTLTYERIETFIKEMILFTEVQVKQAIKQKKILHGFEVINALVTVIDFSEIDYSTQVIDRLMAHCYTSLKTLIRYATTTEKETMIQTLAVQVDDSRRICLYIHTQLNESSENSSADCTTQEETKTAVPKHTLSVKQMEMLNYSASQIHHAVKENWTSSVARSQYVDYLQKKEAYAEAIIVLTASLKLDGHSPDLVLLHRYSLKSLYQKLGDTREYANQIYHLLVENSMVDMNLIHQLKKTCTPREWEKLSARLFEELQNHTGVGLFYSQEKRYDLLLNYVLKAPGLEETSQYFIYLKKHAPEALLQKYEYELRKMARPTGTRPRYHKITQLIAEMASLPNSIVSAQLLIKELNEKYPRRKALLEELKLVEKKL